MTQAAGLFALVLLAAGASADGPPPPPEERAKLESEWHSHRKAGREATKQGDLAAARAAYEKGLAVARRLHPGDHASVATSLAEVAYGHRAMGDLKRAEPPARESLKMRQRLYNGDHKEVADALGNLAIVLCLDDSFAEAVPLAKEAEAMCSRLFQADDPALARSLGDLAMVLRAAGKPHEAEPPIRRALEMRRRLFKGDHPLVAASCSLLAAVLDDRGKQGESERYARETLDIDSRHYKGDHPVVAADLGHLAHLLSMRGRAREAEQFGREGLEMEKRLFKEGHPSLAASLGIMAEILNALDKPAEAEPLAKKALEMAKRQFREQDHSYVAGCRTSLAHCLESQGKLGDAASQLRDALEMNNRLHQGDHPGVATSLAHLGRVLWLSGKTEDALALHRESLAIRNRLYEGDHPSIARALNNLGFTLLSRGKAGEAEAALKASAGMFRRLSGVYALSGSEGDALDFADSFPGARDGHLSALLAGGKDFTEAYAEVWSGKAALTRIYERRSLVARAAAADPAAAGLLDRLTIARLERGRVVLAPKPAADAARRARDAAIKRFDDEIAALSRDLAPLLPALSDADAREAGGPADLAKRLPADAAFVDFVRFTRHTFGPAVPGRLNRVKTPRYLAFITTRGGVTSVDLGDAAPIDEAVAKWRKAVLSAEPVPPGLGAAARAAAFAGVREKLPAGVKSLYLAPDGPLAFVPWAALPGDAAGTILLDDFAVAAVPHGPFLLGALAPAAKLPVRAGALVVGGVDFNAGVVPDPAAAARAPAVGPREVLAWRDLPGTADEAKSVAARAGKEAVLLDGKEATASALLKALPKAGFAHVATHGFFAGPEPRGPGDASPQIAEAAGGRARVGAASPMLLTGIVMAGANDPNLPGRAVVTGEALADLDLGGLRLAVLSACESALGEAVAGEGTFGLQRAFHMAGCRDVVASLWKIDDVATAALMNEFYRRLWDGKLPPAEALRQAQLAIYRNPGLIKALAGPRGRPAVEDAIKVVDAPAPPPKGGATAHPRLWAAFTLSGPGR